MAQPYYQAAYFSIKETAGEVYHTVQTLIYECKGCDLTAYRFVFERSWHIAVLGERPPDDLHEQIEALLTQGTQTTLNSNTITWLMRRREAATLLAPWVEENYLQEEHEPEQQAIERIALSRYPQATGVKEIKPCLMTNEKVDSWFVILKTSKEFEFLTTLVTEEDLRTAN